MENKCESIYTRTEMMLGGDAVERLRGSHVMVFGIGGVGGHATDALARAGIGKLTLVDADSVSVTNLNRQMAALISTVGQNKAVAMKARIADINPECEVCAIDKFYSEENDDQFDLTGVDYIVDCIDSVKSKIALIVRAKREGIKIVSSMGAGNKLDITRFRVADIYKTTHDPLARAIRSELKRRGVDKLKVVFSDEEPSGERLPGAPGSISFVPGAVGLILAGEVIKDISGV